MVWGSRVMLLVSACIGVWLVISYCFLMLELEIAYLEEVQIAGELGAWCVVAFERCLA